MTDRLRANHERFAAHRDAAEAAEAAGDAEGAIAEVEAAAFWAWHNHPGVYASARLEGLLGRLATMDPELAGAAPVRPVAVAAPRRVLHVMTQALPVGGHTRLVERHIRDDAGRSHSVVLTNQGDVEVPGWLESAAAATGGSLTVLPGGPALARARVLRSLATGFDLAVLTLHPWDPVPTLAFWNPAGRPPTVFLNQTDILFWLGAATCDVLVDGRAAGVSLSHARRGIPEWRSRVVSVVLAASGRTIARDRARRSLGVRDDTVLAVTMGSPWKFEPFLDDGTTPGFVELATDAVRRLPRLHVIALGPKAAGPWAEAARVTGGRIEALGFRLDPERYLQAADVYLDSVPMGSNYCMLEAASYGLPLLSYVSDPAGLALICSGTRGIDAARTLATSPAEWAADLERLVEDPAYRAARGDHAEQTILAEHGSERWREAMAEACAAAIAARARRTSADQQLPADVDAPGDSPIDRVLASIVQAQRGLAPTVRTHVRLGAR